MIPAWFLPTVISALTLGFYDITKKHSVKENAVIPVLFFSTLSGSLFCLLCAIGTRNFDIHTLGQVRFQTLVFLKSMIVSASWTCVYYAMRDLPISIVAPIRASSPVCVLIGGLLLYHEIPNVLQAFSMLLVFIGYFAFSIIGKWEGFSFKSSRSIHLLFAGTLIGAGSALYDKYLIGVLHFDTKNVQVYFSIYLMIILGVAYGIQKMFSRHRSRMKFQWRWTIPATGILLIIADYCYFYAVSTPDAHISILSLVRRLSGGISFIFGSLFFHDKFVYRKALALLVILLGVFLLALA